VVPVLQVAREAGAEPGDEVDVSVEVEVDSCSGATVLGSRRMIQEMPWPSAFSCQAFETTMSRSPSPSTSATSAAAGYWAGCGTVRWTQLAPAPPFANHKMDPMPVSLAPAKVRS
jgi:hypothetical protein